MTDCRSLPEKADVPETLPFAVDCAAADKVDARLGKLKCKTRFSVSPNTPVFCVEYVSVVVVLDELPVEPLPEVLLPEVLLPLVELEPLDPVVPLEDEPLLSEVLPVLAEVLLDELVSLELDDESSSVDDESGESRNTTERRSVSIRRNNARATCERSIST